MKYTGRQIIDAIVEQLKKEDILCYDHAIISRLAKLNGVELEQLLNR